MKSLESVLKPEEGPRWKRFLNQWTRSHFDRPKPEQKEVGFESGVKDRGSCGWWEWWVGRGRWCGRSRERRGVTRSMLVVMLVMLVCCWYGHQKVSIKGQLVDHASGWFFPVLFSALSFLWHCWFDDRKGFHTLTTLAGVSISCCHVSVCPSVTSRCSTEMAKCRITQTMPYDSPGTLVFWCQKSRQNSNRVSPNGGAKCRWGRFSAGAVAENWRRLMRSVVSLARSQVYCTEHPPYLFAARLP